MRKLLSIILVLGVCVGGAGAQSTWYPRSANYVTSGDFIGSGLNISGDGYIGGNLTVVGNVTAPGGAAFLSEMVINVPISASSVDQFVFVSDGAWTITSVKEIHAVAGNDGSDVNFTVMVCDDGEGPDEGLMVHNSTVDLKAGAKTIQEADISGLAANVTLANNDTIAVDFQGNLATLAGGVITIEMKR